MCFFVTQCITDVKPSITKKNAFFNLIKQFNLRPGLFEKYLLTQTKLKQRNLEILLQMIPACYGQIIYRETCKDNFLKVSHLMLKEVFA